MSDWCEIEMLRDGEPPAGSETFGMMLSVRSWPWRALLESTTNVELIAATYIRFPSFEKWMSCGRHSPFVSAPDGRLHDYALRRSATPAAGSDRRCPSSRR